MIRISINKKQGKITGFTCKGHAGYARSGKDIICSAVSVLTINTVNSIEAFTDDHIVCTQDDGALSCSLSGEVSPASELLLQSMQLGLETIQNEYGSEYVCVTVVD